MKILLVQPDVKRRNPAPSSLLPSYSLNLLATILRRHGHQVEVLDPLISYALLAGESEVSVLKALELLLKKETFDLVGVAVYTPMRWEALEIIRAVKHRNRKTTVVVGGPHPTRLGDDMLIRYRTLIDYVCLGAAEESLPALIEAAGKGPAYRVRTPGIMYRQGPVRIRRTSDPVINVAADKLPDVRYDRYMEFFPEGLPRAYVITARGCIHWCNFCSNLWKKVIIHPPESVIRQVKHLAQDCKAKEIIFYDDCLGMKPEQTIEILGGIAGLNLNVPLQAVSRFDLLSDEFIGAFKRAGGRDMILGLETGSTRLRRKMNKHLTSDAICQGAEKLRRLGLRMGLYLMFGFPGETDQDVEQTYRLVKKLEPEQVLATMFDVKPGDVLFEFAMKSQMLKPEDWSKKNRPPLISYDTQAESEISAGRAMLFEELFNRTILMPEHDSAGSIMGFNQEQIAAVKAQARERLFHSADEAQKASSGTI